MTHPSTIFGHVIIIKIIGTLVHTITLCITSLISYPSSPCLLPTDMLALSGNAAFPPMHCLHSCIRAFRVGGIIITSPIRHDQSHWWNHLTYPPGALCVGDITTTLPIWRSLRWGVVITSSALCIGGIVIMILIQRNPCPWQYHHITHPALSPLVASSSYHYSSSILCVSALIVITLIRPSLCRCPRHHIIYPVVSGLIITTSCTLVFPTAPVSWYQTSG
jgi:hypothetical protein